MLVLVPGVRFREETCVAFPFFWIRRDACAGWPRTVRVFVRWLLLACALGRVSSALFLVVVCPLKEVVGVVVGFRGGECGDRARWATPVFRW